MMKSSIVVTGGIATGKSTFIRLFRDAWKGELELFDCDNCVHELLTTPSVIASIEGGFGSQVLTDSGEVDRELLGALVFGDTESKTHLESILHPLVRAACKRQLEDFQSSDQQGIFIADVPLFYESKFPVSFDAVIVIATSEITQVQRLMNRTGWSSEEAALRIKAQDPISTKVAKADRLIWNEGSSDSLLNQISLLARSLQQHSKT